jgi:hypothetical protein
MALEINETNFEELVLKSETPVLVDSRNDEEQIFEIVVVAHKKLNDDEMLMVGRNFVSRLHGYTTECPEELKGAKIELRPRFSK